MGNCNPKNETLVDGKPVDGKVAIVSGMIISIMGRCFRYEANKIERTASEEDVTVCLRDQVRAFSCMSYTGAHSSRGGF